MDILLIPSVPSNPVVGRRAVIDGDNWLRNPPHPKDKPTLFRCTYICSCMPAVRRNKKNMRSRNISGELILLAEVAVVP